MKAAPDGYTVCATSAGVMSVNPALRKEPSYDVSKFSAIVHTGTLQQLMLANLATPGNSMKEVFAAAKAKPGSIRATTNGMFSDDHMAIVTVAKATGAQFALVHFDGTPEEVAEEIERMITLSP